MLIIRTYAALSDASAVLAGNEVHTLLEAHVERLADYADFDLTDLAMFAIVCPRDTLDSIEHDLGRPLIDSGGTCFIADAVSAGGTDPPASRRPPRRNRHRPAERRALVGRQLCQREGTGPRAAGIPGRLVISLAPGTKVYLGKRSQAAPAAAELYGTTN